MVLEFDCEVALLQSALQNIQRKYGAIQSLPRNKLISAIEDFRLSVEDIISIREDDGVSDHQADHRNRKLVAGLLCVIFREKLDSWDPGEYFEPINTVYPPIGWNFFLDVVKVFQWADYFIELMESVHPDTMLESTREILNCLWDVNNHNNVSLLIRLLSLLSKPTHYQNMRSTQLQSEIVNDDTSLRLEKYKAQIKTITEFLLDHLNQKKRWPERIVIDYFTCLFTNLTKLYYGFILGKFSTELKPRESSLASTVTMLSAENLEGVHESFCEKTEIMGPTDIGGINLVEIDWILQKCCHLAYESLLLLDCGEFNLLVSKPSKSMVMTNDNSSGDLRISFFIFEKICQRILSNLADRSEKLISIIQLIYQRMETLRDSISLSASAGSEDIIAIIDSRRKRYEECIDHIITTPVLSGHGEFLQCLLRNASLLTTQQAHNLMLQIETGKSTLSSVEIIQEVVVTAFASWPWTVQQQFQQDCLLLYKDSTLLLMKSFEEHLTMTFNKMVNADVKANGSLTLQMSRLCLQSPRRTITQAVFQAMNSKAQGNVLVQSLTSVWSACRFRRNPADPTLLCNVLNDVLLNYCLSEMQFQNLKTFMRKLLKAKPDPSFKVAFIEGTLITRAELVCTCILPYLDEWNPGHGCRLTLFAIQLLQLVLNAETVSKNFLWLRQFKPCVFLCYLTLIIGQCQLVHGKNEQIDWIPMKSQAVAAIMKLTDLIREEPEAFITKEEVMWLCEKVRLADESLAFYFTDLCDHFHVELNNGKTGDTIEVIFEFSCCSDTNTWTAMPWFGRAIADFGSSAKIRILHALKTILPFSLPEEWKRITLLLEYVLRNQQLSVPSNSYLTVTSEDGKILCSLASLLINTIFLCNSSGINVQYMMQCFIAIVKDRLTALEEKHKEIDLDLSAISANIFVGVCLLTNQLSPKSGEESKVLLMELGQRKLKNNRYQGNDRVTKVMVAAASKLNGSTLKNNLLKALTHG